MASDLDIERERLDILAAPGIPIVTGQVGRCSWCGRIGDVVLVDTMHGVERYKGVNCCGGRHL